MDQDVRTQISGYAIDNFKNGLNCSESVFDALLRAGVLQLPASTLAMCIGFGGGVGLSGSTCGAILAAVMANGALYGRPAPRSVDLETRLHEISGKYYRRYNNMIHDFASANGGVLCREICAPFEDWHSKERRKTCMKLIGATAALAYDYLNMPQETAFELPYKGNMAGME